MAVVVVLTSCRDGTVKRQYIQYVRQKGGAYAVIS